MSGKGRQTARKPATKFAHLQKRRLANQVARNLQRRRRSK